MIIYLYTSIDDSRKFINLSSRMLINLVFTLNYFISFIFFINLQLTKLILCSIYSYQLYCILHKYNQSFKTAIYITISYVLLGKS